MNRSRAKDYQENRIKMIQELIKESCEFLFEMKIIINATLQKTLTLEHRFQKHLNGVYSFT